MRNERHFYSISTSNEILKILQTKRIYARNYFYCTLKRSCLIILCLRTSVCTFWPHCREDQMWRCWSEVIQTLHSHPSVYGQAVTSLNVVATDGIATLPNAAWLWCRGSQPYQSLRTGVSFWNVLTSQRKRSTKPVVMTLVLSKHY
jgi:hypothetical protein